MGSNGCYRLRKDGVKGNGDLTLSSAVNDIDPWTAWAYRPHTVTLLLLGACLLIWSSGVLDPDKSVAYDVITSVKRGVLAMIAVFLAYCLLQAPSTILIRPHPAIWRLVHGMAVIYLVALTFLLFQVASLLSYCFAYWTLNCGLLTLYVLLRIHFFFLNISMFLSLQYAFIFCRCGYYWIFFTFFCFLWGGSEYFLFTIALVMFCIVGKYIIFLKGYILERSEVSTVNYQVSIISLPRKAYVIKKLSAFKIFQKRDDARQFMKFLHQDLGVELPERSYGADCRIYLSDNPTSRFKNVYETLFDEFVLAHIFGWWGKAIMIRNQPLLWVLSIGFEMMELTFRHMLPNFNECWWDSIILDILICNWFGIWAGMRTVRYFDGRTYEWVGISRQPNIIGKVKRTLGQFTPAQWDKDEWHPLLGPWRFIQVLSLCIVFLTVELNTFFLKFCLWIPPRNPVIIYRLILWWLIALPTIREYNSYLKDRKPVKKLGAFCWLSLAICIVELLICIKFGRGLYPNSMPSWLIVFWGSVGLLIMLFLAVWSWHLHRSLRKKMR
ncbi:CDP-diacylglycerol--serine O-phosphatidyltransferase 1-like isoform X1 [Nymphaea colorata]|nr:CDP-diacylglycerol--serine O-phosphatidyltransferase 1-like isoform X1 [Nymphaea colorata]XP_049932319.1 CDP-diacylglycerol--serine O-phosphatidyltransferase 1-like isoform X1 [Nymphaea colorata]XP_049932320.1 CDP-diacylglycerol--serine O-phosphatidyltransferase 1-like isoform X1 [Nymphaea colorata]XP_049932321.1 CDP-diacylglycerol--serine O-phosphatidyltransferase 1-like isoform X1 [Nymphaea colorata]